MPSKPTAYQPLHALKRAEQRRLHSDRDRGTSSQRGYNADWQRARVVFLNDHPWCCHCARDGIMTEATVVDHIIPHRGNDHLFNDQGNWQALCKRCHDRKTGRGE